MNPAESSCAVIAGKLSRLPPFGPAVLKLLGISLEDDSAVASFEEAFKSDPALTAELLVLANSAAFGGRSRVQTIGLAIVSRSYAAHLGLLPASERLENRLERITLERGLVIGVVAVLLGIAAFVFALVRWGSEGFGALDPMTTMRVPILGMVFIIGGLQLIMVSFTMSLSRISTR